MIIGPPNVKLPVDRRQIKDTFVHLNRITQPVTGLKRSVVSALRTPCDKPRIVRNGKCIRLRFARLGYTLSRQTLANWIIYGAETWLAPLYLAMKVYLLRQQVRHADETTLQVQREPGKSASGWTSDFLQPESAREIDRISERWPA